MALRLSANQEAGQKRQNGLWPRWGCAGMPGLQRQLFRELHMCLHIVRNPICAHSSFCRLLFLLLFRLPWPLTLELPKPFISNYRDLVSRLEPLDQIQTQARKTQECSCQPLEPISRSVSFPCNLQGLAVSRPPCFTKELKCYTVQCTPAQTSQGATQITHAFRNYLLGSFFVIAVASCVTQRVLPQARIPQAEDDSLRGQ